MQSKIEQSLSYSGIKIQLCPSYFYSLKHSQKEDSSKVMFWYIRKFGSEAKHQTVDASGSMNEGLDNVLDLAMSPCPQIRPQFPQPGN